MISCDLKLLEDIMITVRDYHCAVFFGELVSEQAKDQTKIKAFDKISDLIVHRNLDKTKPKDKPETNNDDGEWVTIIDGLENFFDD